MSRKGVIYVRVSTKEQEREGYSIPAQKKFLIEYAEKNNIEIVKIFEESESAKSSGRIQFKNMLDFLDKNKDIEHLLVEKTDRLSRNMKDFAKIDPNDWPNLSVHLVKENEVISKKSRSHQKFVFGMKGLMAKNFSDNLSEEVIKGSDEKAAKGGWPGPAPLGYKNKLDDKTIIIHKQEAPLIKKAFEMAASGQYSLSKLAKELYNMGLRSKRVKGKLYKGGISRILNNPFYYGYFLRKEVLYKGAHKPIISKELFDKVQYQLGHVKKPASTKLLLTYRGSMTCSHCGCAITGEKKKGKYIYYHCTNGKGICKNVVYVREENIEEQIKLALQKIKIPKDVLEWTRQKLLDDSREDQNLRAAQISMLNKRYKDLEHRISHSYDHYLDGKIDTEMWEVKSKQWKDEKTEIQQQLDTLELNRENSMKHGIKLMELASKASSLFNDMTSYEKREIVSLVLSNPRIENGSLQYDYKKPFSMFVNVTDLAKWRGGRDSNPRPPA